jgi:hypothetical protein
VLSVRSISSYPGDPAKVDLFYGQSWSLVKFLNDEYGGARFAELFATVKTGKRIDSALEAVYGFDQDGLEDEWRASLGLPPRETPPPDGEPAATSPAASGVAQKESGNGGTSAGTVAAILVGTLALAGVIAFAGFTIARKLR